METQNEPNSVVGDCVGCSEEEEEVREVDDETRSAAGVPNTVSEGTMLEPRWKAMGEYPAATGIAGLEAVEEEEEEGCGC